jgi:DNA-binding CsgD family transcriptional regulator
VTPGVRITSRQYEFARLVATGVPRHEVARRLDVKVNTVHAMMSRLHHRLGVRSRRELAAALPAVTVRDLRGQGGGKCSRFGLTPGDPVRITGGRFAGRTGEYAGNNNSAQIRIRIGGGVFALRAAFVQRIDDQAAA